MTSEPDEVIGPNYQRHHVEDLDAVLELGRWIHAHAAARSPIGVAAWPHSGMSAFADQQAVWLVQSMIEDGRLAAVLRSTFMQTLTQPGGPALIARNLQVAYTMLRDFLRLEAADPEQALVGNFVGCLDSLGYTIGHRIYPPHAFPSAAEDAMDALLTEQQLAIDRPPYYQQVALPNARNRALGARPWREAGQVAFTVAYKHLLLRVLAHFSDDPTLLRLLTTPEADVIGGLAGRLNMPPAQVEPFLIWAALTSNQQAFDRFFPELLGRLPEDPYVVQRLLLDKTMPNIRRFVVEHEELCRDNCGAVSLYGRPSPYTRDVPEAMHHLVFGSVRDIIEVAMASILHLVGATGEVFEVSAGGGWESAELTGYAVADPFIFEEQLTAIARLGDPLGSTATGGVPLEPTVFVRQCDEEK